MRPTPTFYANHRFDPQDGAKWADYVAWAKIPGLIEIVGLDGILCESVTGLFPAVPAEAPALSPDGIPVVGSETTLAILSSRFASESRINLLGLYRDPGRHVTTSPAAGFVFLGYELIEEATRVSALSNCGGFPDVFRNDELNRYGLFSDFKRADEVRRRLPGAYPGEPHARCALYAIWRRD